MISWRSLTLQFLCLFLCRLQLTEGNCRESLDPGYWEKTKITFQTLTERIPLVDADSFENLIMCTLGNEIKKGRAMKHLLNDCMEYYGDDEALRNSSNCGDELPQSVSFFDFMCLVAKASDMHDEIKACSHDVVVELYSRFHKTPIETTLPTTKQPPTTTTLTTTTAKSTTAERSTKHSPPPVTTWSTRPPASSAGSQSSAGDVSWNKVDYNRVQTNKVVTDGVVYSLLGLSVLMNLVLAFCVALLCSRRRLNQSTVNSAAYRNGHTEGTLHLVTSRPGSAEDPSAADSSINMDSSSFL